MAADSATPEKPSEDQLALEFVHAHLRIEEPLMRRTVAHPVLIDSVLVGDLDEDEFPILAERHGAVAQSVLQIGHSRVTEYPLRHIGVHLTFVILRRNVEHHLGGLVPRIILKRN